MRATQRAILIIDINVSEPDKYVGAELDRLDAFNEIMTGSRGTRKHAGIFRVASSQA